MTGHVLLTPHLVATPSRIGEFHAHLICNVSTCFTGVGDVYGHVTHVTNPKSAYLEVRGHNDLGVWVTKSERTVHSAPVIASQFRTWLVCGGRAVEVSF